MAKCQKCGSPAGFGEKLCRACWTASMQEQSSPGVATQSSAESALTYQPNIGQTAASRPHDRSVPVPHTRRAVESPARDGPIGALRVFAWLDLVGGIVGAVLIWNAIGSIDVPSTLGVDVSHQTNPVGILLSLGLLAQGVFLWALFLVIAGAAEDLAAMRRHQAVAEV